PRGGRRPGLEHGRRQRQRGRPARRRGRGPARTAGERAPGQPAPEGHGAVHRQPRRVARPPAAPAPRAGGLDRRRRAGGPLPAAADAARPSSAGGARPAARRGEPAAAPGAASPRRPRRGAAGLSFISTVAAFGTPLDVTVSELAIASFSPADAATARALGDAR